MKACVLKRTEKAKKTAAEKDEKDEKEVAVVVD
jgi:hypothetical protein